LQNSNPLNVIKSFFKGAYQTTIGIVPALAQEQWNKIEKLRAGQVTFEPWEKAKEQFAKMPEEWRITQDAYYKVKNSKDPLGTYIDLIRNKPENRAMKAQFDKFLSDPNAIAQVLGNLAGMVVTGVVTKKVVPKVVTGARLAPSVVKATGMPKTFGELKTIVQNLKTAVNVAHLPREQFPAFVASAQRCTFEQFASFPKAMRLAIVESLKRFQDHNSGVKSLVDRFKVFESNIAKQTKPTQKPALPSKQNKGEAIVLATKPGALAAPDKFKMPTAVKLVPIAGESSIVPAPQRKASSVKNEDQNQEPVDGKSSGNTAVATKHIKTSAPPTTRTITRERLKTSITKVRDQLNLAVKNNDLHGLARGLKALDKMRTLAFRKEHSDLASIVDILHTDYTKQRKAIAHVVNYPKNIKLISASGGNFDVITKFTGAIEEGRWEREKGVLSFGDHGLSAKWLEDKKELIANCDSLGDLANLKLNSKEIFAQEVQEAKSLLRQKINILTEKFSSQVNNMSTKTDLIHFLDKQGFLNKDKSIRVIDLANFFGLNKFTKISNIIASKAVILNKKVTITDTAHSLIDIMLHDKDLQRYRNNIFSELKRQSNPSEWQSIKAMMIHSGIKVPLDTVLDMVVPANIPLFDTSHMASHTRRFTEYEGLTPLESKLYENELDILQPKSTPSTRELGSLPSQMTTPQKRSLILEMIKDPLKALQQAYPDRTPAEIRNIFRFPGSKYPVGNSKTGEVPRVSNIASPNGLVREQNVNGESITMGAIEKKVTDNNGTKTTIYVMHMDKMDKSARTVSRSGVVEPKILFRFDTRTPETIKKPWDDGDGPGGLYGIGTNLDASDHAFKGGFGRIAYVSASENMYTCLHGAAKAQFNTRDKNEGYIYVLRNRGSISKDFTMQGNGANETEHLIVGGIPYEDIVGYIKFKRVSPNEVEFSKILTMP
jgi:hypothetical protein